MIGQTTRLSTGIEKDFIMQCICGQEIVKNNAGRKRTYCSDACQQTAYRNRKRDKRNRLLKEQRSKLFIVPCSLDTANAFVSLFHRHNQKMPGAKFCLGIIDTEGLLRGVAIVGRPVARMLDDTWTLEVNRLATDGCQNACSALYAAARKTVFDMGYHRLITYTLVTESGSSMRGAGWKKTQETHASDGWLNRTGRKNQQVYQVNKWRWETINPMKGHPHKIILPEGMQQEAMDTQQFLFAYPTEKERLA